MKKTNIYLGWLLSFLLILIIAACGPASTQTAESEADEHETSEETSVEEETGEEEEAVVEEAEPESGASDIQGSQTTATGLQYIEIEAGSGPVPNVGDTVTVHYTGTLEDGTEFDSSAGAEPIEFPLGVGYVIPGWDEGISLMREGGKAQLIIPPELAYGPQERPNIPANSTLYFDVELVSVAPPPTPTPAPPPTSFEDSDYTTTDSGIKYAVISEGDGEMPVEDEIVTIHFVGWSEDGSMIGDSRQAQPLTFTVGKEEILAGWDEAVALMQLGEVTQFIIPSDLAFGSEGIDGLVEPDTDVTFEIQLLNISPPPPPPVSVDEEDYVVTDSGVKIFTLEEGDGESPQEGDTVEVHYRLWLDDGTPIDSSYDYGEPFSFSVGLGGTIPGWEEGILTMVEGETAQIVVPPDQGYGDADNGPIPANSTLIFEVELLSVASESGE